MLFAYFLNKWHSQLWLCIDDVAHVLLVYAT